MILVDQYRSNTEGGIGNYTGDSVVDYIELIKEGNVSEIIVNSTDVTQGQSTVLTFSDSCVILPFIKMDADKCYYFHGKVKMEESGSQTFYILLLDSTGVNSQQYVKSVTISGGRSDLPENNFIDVEFVFKPFTTYDTICFELVRETKDYINPRKPCIIYQELSVIKNLIETKNLGNSKQLKKIGIQTRPSALMAINGEEIRVGRSGIYELREDSIPITSFSLFTGAKDVLTDSDITNGRTNIVDLYKNTTNSVCLFAHEKEREIVPFSLDYIYEN